MTVPWTPLQVEVYNQTKRYELSISSRSLVTQCHPYLLPCGISPPYLCSQGAAGHHPIFDIMKKNLLILPGGIIVFLISLIFILCIVLCVTCRRNRNKESTPRASLRSQANEYELESVKPKNHSRGHAPTCEVEEDYDSLHIYDEPNEIAPNMYENTIRNTRRNRLSELYTNMSRKYTFSR